MSDVLIGLAIGGGIGGFLGWRAGVWATCGRIGRAQARAIRKSIE